MLCDFSSIDYFGVIELNGNSAGKIIKSIGVIDRSSFGLSTQLSDPSVSILF